MLLMVLATLQKLIAVEPAPFVSFKISYYVFFFPMLGCHGLSTFNSFLLLNLLLMAQHQTRISRCLLKKFNLLKKSVGKDFQLPLYKAWLM